jgi:hypothetical protein
MTDGVMFTVTTVFSSMWPYEVYGGGNANRFAFMNNPG